MFRSQFSVYQLQLSPKEKKVVESIVKEERKNYDVYLEYPVIYLDPVNGDDFNTGTSVSQPIRTLEEAYRRCYLGKHTRIEIKGSGDPSNPAVVLMPRNYLGGFTYVVGKTNDWGALSDGTDILITDNGESGRRLGFIWGRHLLIGVSIEATAGPYSPLHVYGSVVSLYKCKLTNKVPDLPVAVVGLDSGGGLLRLNMVELSNEGGNVGIKMKAPCMCYGVNVTFDSNISTHVQKDDENLCITNL